MTQEPKPPATQAADQPRRPLFSTITADDWKRSIARSRQEKNVVWERIQEELRKNGRR